MGGALFSGLAEGFGILGKSVLDDQDRAEKEASEERLLKLKSKLTMDLMSAKYQFMKQNPQYKHFATDLSGNIIGFDEYGSPKVLHEASPEERSIRLDKARADASTKTAAETKDLAEAGLAEARTASVNERTAHPDRFFKPGSGKTPALKADPFIKTPAELDKIIKGYMPKLIVDNAGPGDDMYDKAYAVAQARAQKEGYTVGRQYNAAGGGLAAPASQSPNGAGVFQGLIPQDGTVTDDDTSDESDASPMLMDDEEDNR